ncbi:efflux RND transporter periplasmic adaptor subunit [bacterium]|nr:efflux RND transporter periplasmic adaptor subunit [bacterium]
MQLKLIYSLFFLALLTACGSNYSTEEDDHDEEQNQVIVSLSEAQYQQAGIELARAQEIEMGAELKVSGIIDVPPRSNISINLPYGGFLKYTKILPGSRVKKGELLATIENPEFIQFQQNYLEARAMQQYLKSEYERQKSLYEQNVAAGKNFQQAESAYLSNEAKLKAMAARLRLIGYNPEKIDENNISAVISIYAPVSGSVNKVYTNIGRYINPQEPIMDITNAEDLHVELTVYENDIPKVKEGEKIRFAIATEPDNWREAKIFLVGGNVREDRSVTVHGHLTENYGDLLPGMYVTAFIETNKQLVQALPEEAVVRYNGKHYIFIAQAQHDQHYEYEMREIQPGTEENGFVEIINNDLPLDNVVVKGAFTLLAKAKNTEEEGGGHGH